MKASSRSRANVTAALNGGIRSGTKHLNGVKVAPVTIVVMPGYNPPLDQLHGTVELPSQLSNRELMEKTLQAIHDAEKK